MYHMLIHYKFRGANPVSSLGGIIGQILPNFAIFGGYDFQLRRNPL